MKAEIHPEYDYDRKRREAGWLGETPITRATPTEEPSEEEIARIRAEEESADRKRRHEDTRRRLKSPVLEQRNEDGTVTFKEPRVGSSEPRPQMPKPSKPRPTVEQMKRTPGVPVQTGRLAK